MSIEDGAERQVVEPGAPRGEDLVRPGQIGPVVVRDTAEVFKGRPPAREHRGDGRFHQERPEVGRPPDAGAAEVPLEPSGGCPGGDPQRQRRPRVRSGDGVENERDIRDGAGHRAVDVERKPGRRAGPAGDTTGRRAESDHVAEAGRVAERSAPDRCHRRSVPCRPPAPPRRRPLLPPQVFVGSYGLRVAPNTALKVCDPAPNSGVFVFPSVMAPARRSRSTMRAVSSGTWCSKASEPNVVRMPAVTKRSLCATGNPHRGPGFCPCASAASVASASASARSGSRVTMAFQAGIDLLDTPQVGRRDLTRRDLPPADQRGEFARRAVAEIGGGRRRRRHARIVQGPAG